MISPLRSPNWEAVGRGAAYPALLLHSILDNVPDRAKAVNNAVSRGDFQVKPVFDLHSDPLASGRLLGSPCHRSRIKSTDW